MSWLDEEEANVALCHTDEKYYPIRMRDPDRALRVIREQSEYMKKVTEIATNALDGMENLTHGLSKTLVIGVKNELVHIQHNLSPDAKEVIDELARLSSKR